MASPNKTEPLRFRSNTLHNGKLVTVNSDEDDSVTSYWNDGIIVRFHCFRFIGAGHSKDPVGNEFQGHNHRLFSNRDLLCVSVLRLGVIKDNGRRTELAFDKVNKILS